MSQRSYIYLCILVLALIGLYVYVGYKPLINDIPKIDPKISPQSQRAVDWITAHSEWYQHGNDTGWAGFDRVYFITLEKRLDNVKQVAERLGIANSASILKAFYKNDLDLNELMTWGLLDKSFLVSLPVSKYGCIGCQLSHLAAMLDCFSDPKAQTCVIFEDDLLKPAKTITAQILDFRKRVEQSNIDWDMLYLDYSFEVGRGKTKSDIRVLESPLLCHAYVVKKNIVPLIVAASLPMHTFSDVVLQELVKNKALVALGPDKARYFSQTKLRIKSEVNPEMINYNLIQWRYDS